MPRDLELLQRWKAEPATERERAAMDMLELTDYEIYSRKLELICWEGRDILQKMGVSPMIEAGDVIIGIYTAQGDLAVGVMGTHLHMINGQIGIKYILKYFKDDPLLGIHPGDILYFNEALVGGMHNPDQIMCMPIFHGEELIAWVAVAAHEIDTGATEPGGNPPSAKSRYDEGLKITPLRIGQNRLLRPDIIGFFENMVRDPRQMTQDIKARLAICVTVERRVQALVEKKGADFLIAIMRKMIEESAEAAHRRIASFNDGSYRQVTFLENAGAGKYGLLRAYATVQKQGDKVTIDFTGTGPRAAGGNFNTFPHCMIAMTACYLYQFLFFDLRPSIGLFAPFEFVFPEGCFLDADADDAVSLGVSTIAHVLTAVHNCFERMKFGNDQTRQFVKGSWPGSSNTVALGGISQHGLPFAAWDQGIPNGDAMGAALDMDGTDAGGFIWCAIGEFLDCEQFEMQYPVVNLFRNRYRKDSAGPGKYRGGRAVAMCHIIHGTPALIAVNMGGYGKTSPNRGLFGGYAAPPVAKVWVRRNNLREIIEKEPDRIPIDIESLLGVVKGDYSIVHPNSGADTLQEGDCIITMSLGAPGYGDPLERDAELVMKDLEEESISEWAAENVYHVVWDRETGALDYEATAAAREQERRRRQKSQPYQKFTATWSQRRPPEEALQLYGTWPDAQALA